MIEANRTAKLVKRMNRVMDGYCRFHEYSILKRQGSDQLGLYCKDEWLMSVDVSSLPLARTLTVSAPILYPVGPVNQILLDSVLLGLPNDNPATDALGVEQDRLIFVRSIPLPSLRGTEFGIFIAMNLDKMMREACNLRGHVTSGLAFQYRIKRN